MQGIFDKLGQFITDLFNFFRDIISWFVKLVGQVFTSLWTMLTDFIFYTFDKILDLIVLLINQIPTVPIPNFWGLIPAQTANILGLIGVGQALGMIVASLIIRFTLQLIPFVRLGS